MTARTVNSVQTLYFIRCFACTSVCTSGAKQKVVQPLEQLASWFTHRSTERGEPLLFF